MFGLVQYPGYFPVVSGFAFYFIFIVTGTSAFDKLNRLLMSSRLLGDIKKLSPDAQTSCLEGFQATLSDWHPKMVCFSPLGTFCRYIMTSLN